MLQAAGGIYGGLGADATCACHLCIQSEAGITVSSSSRTCGSQIGAMRQTDIWVNVTMSNILESDAIEYQTYVVTSECTRTSCPYTHTQYTCYIAI